MLTSILEWHIVLLKLYLILIYILFVCLRLYFRVNNFSVILGRLPGFTSTKQWG